FNLASGRVYVPGGSGLRVLDADDDSEIALIGGVGGGIIAVDPLANQIFLGNAASASVHVIDGSSHAVQTLASVFDPIAIAVNPQTRRFYVVQYGGNVAEFDAVTLARTDIAVAERPSDLVIDAALNQLYVAHSPTSTDPAAITVIDGATRVATPIAVGARPGLLAFDAGTRRLFVVNRLAGSTSVIDADTQTVVAGIATCSGSQANYIALNPVTHRVYVKCQNTGVIAVIDGATLDVATHAAAIPGSSKVFDSVQRRIVSANYTDTLRLIDAETGAVTTVVPVPAAAIAQLAFDAAGNRIVALLSDGRVALIDGDDLEVRISAVIATAMQSVLVDAARDRVLLADTNGDQLRILACATLAVSSIAIADQPYYLALDEATGTVYVGHTDAAKTLTRIDGTTLTPTTVTLSARTTRLVFDRATQRLFASMLNVPKLAVLDASTLATSEVNLVANAGGMALNPQRGQLLIGHQGFETRLSLLNTATLATPSTLDIGTAASWVLVDSVNDRSFALGMDGGGQAKAVVLRGPANAMVSRNLASGAQAPLLDPLRGRAFFSDGSNLLRLNSEPAAAHPLTTTITSSNGHRTESASASLNFSASSSVTPNAPQPLALFYRVDHGALGRATASGPGSFDATVPLTLGLHDVQAFALDALGAVTQGSMGSSLSITVHNAEAGRMAAFPIARVLPTSVATTTSIGTITPAVSVVGQGYDVPVTVSGSGTPTGNVQVEDGAGAQCQVTLLAGSGSCTLASADVGPHTITAQYAGEGLFQPSSGSASHDVQAAASTTTIQSDAPDPSVANQSVSVQVMVVAAAPGAGTPGGVVAISTVPAGATCNATLAGGSGSCTLALPANGDYAIGAEYAGDVRFLASSASAVPHRVEDGADLSLSVSDGQTQMVAGTSTQYAVSVGSAGPTAVANARVQSLLDPALAAGAWSCTSSGAASCIAGQPSGTTANGSGALDQWVDIASGGQLDFLFTATLAASHVGSVSAGFAVGSDRADANPANNLASDSNSTRRVADLSVVKTNQGSFVPAGGCALYRISVSNAGPSDAPGTRIQDAPSGVLSADSWFCSPFAGAACASNGSGDLDLLADLPAGSHVEIGFLVAVGDGPPTVVTNTATIAAGIDVEDSTPSNNSASDTDRVALFANGFDLDCEPL
ncbi:MAG: Ig-like domain repeat protein, partial [Xanthomonadales bacterium]|nr:Ig-like domain repeat protein [Xanthomonadales bacterium]